MTWKELALEIMRQPEWLTQQDVKLWDETEDNAQVWDAIEFVCPTNPSQHSDEWTEDSGYYMSLCFDRKPNPYIAHMKIPISVWFRAKDESEAEKVTLKLRDRITRWTRRQGEDKLVDDIMENLLETEVLEVQDDFDDTGVADYLLTEDDVNQILGKE